MTVPASVSYYTALVTSQYQNSPNFLSWLGKNVGFFDDAFQCLQTFLAKFDFATATGAQLDILGTILGQSRQLNFQPTSGSPILGDADYSLLLQAKIGFNNWNGKTDSLNALWAILFPSGAIYVLDQQNMTFTVILIGTFTQIQKDLITNGLIVPRPEAVLVNYVFGVKPFFGFGFQSGVISGFGTGHWV